MKDMIANLSVKKYFDEQNGNFIDVVPLEELFLALDLQKKEVENHIKNVLMKTIEENCDVYDEFNLVLEGVE